MRLFLILVLLALPFGLDFTADTANADRVADGPELGGRKTVTVYADSIAAAMALAESQNSGWTAISARKSSKDDKSRAYQVTMKK